MADNEDRTETAPKGNEWEVVSLTESAYAAAPGPKQVDPSEDNQGNSVGESEAETSRAMFMSGHFLFPQSQHENLLLEPEYDEIRNEKGDEGDLPYLIAEEKGKLDVKDEEKVSIEELTSDEFPGVQSQHENLPLEPDYDEIRNEKGDEGDLPYLIAEEKGKLDVKDEEKVSIEELTSDEFPGVQDFDEKDNRLSVGGADLQKDTDREQFISGSAEFSAFHNISNMGRSYTVEEDAMTDDMAEPFQHASNSSSPSFQKPVEENKYDRADLPCEAWWKRQALSLYAHAKEANTFWSIIIATAVTGLVIIGHKWQQERWQILQLRRQFSFNDEKMGRILGPLSRFLKM